MDSQLASATDAAALAGQRVAFTGRLASLTRTAASEILRSRGATVTPRVSRATTFLVVGAGTWPLGRSGRLTRNLQTARWLQSRGVPLEVVSEEQFLQRVGLAQHDDTASRHYTAADLVRLLDVSPTQLRRWIDCGLVQPVEQPGQIARFDFRQVSRVRSLLALVQSGIELRQLRRSLRQIERWLPLARDAGACASQLESHGARLVFKTPDGRLVEPHGQFVFQFEDREPGPETIPFSRQTRADQLFGLAVSYEEQGDLSRSIDAYEQLLLLEGSDPEVCFNLANALYASRQIDAAIERYHEATCMDPVFLEAWNNLGNALAEQGRRREAIAALQHAVAIDPDYSDAQYSLADVLEVAGAAEQARPHWEAYLSLEPAGAWADHARDRLQISQRSGSA